MMAGWSSNNKYSLIGAFRGVAQLISYEVPLFLSLLVPVFLARSMGVNTIVDAQAFGEGQEHHTLQPVLNTVRERFKRLGIKTHNPIITTDSGYANEANVQVLH